MLLQMVKKRKKKGYYSSYCDKEKNNKPVIAQLRYKQSDNECYEISRIASVTIICI